MVNIFSLSSFILVINFWLKRFEISFAIYPIYNIGFLEFNNCCTYTSISTCKLYSFKLEEYIFNEN